MIQKLKDVSALTAFTMCACGFLCNPFYAHANDSDLYENEDRDEVAFEDDQDLWDEEYGITSDKIALSEEENDYYQGLQDIYSPMQERDHRDRNEAFSGIADADMQNEEDSASSSKLRKSSSMHNAVACPPLDGDPVVGGYGVFLTADALAWKVKEDGLGYAIKNHTPINNASNEVPYPNNDAKVKHFDFDWGGGFRLGLGGHFPKRKWDLGLTWTWYQQHTHAHTHANAEEELFATWMSPEAPGNHPFSTCYHAKASWNMHYNILDLDLGRYCALSRYFSVRPHVGIRSAWIHQKFDVHYRDFPGFGVNVGFDKVAVDLKNNFWGWGIRAGLDTAWTLWRCWSLFGNAAFSLLWGNFHLFNKEIDYPTGLPAIHQVNIKESYRTLCGNLECALGVRWDYRFHTDRYHLAFSLGWEEVFWFDQNQLNQLANADTTGLVKMHNDVALAGITLHMQFDF